jgi:hypothetical protein
MYIDNEMSWMKVGEIPVPAPAPSAAQTPAVEFKSLTADMSNNWTPVVKTIPLQNGKVKFLIHLEVYHKFKIFAQRITGYVAICASDFYDALIAHDSVRETYLHYEAASTLRRDSGNGFTFGNITFLDCTDVAVDLQGNEVKYVEDGVAYVVPTGTQLFHTYYAPADFIETVNTRGRRIYVKQKARDYNRGIDIHSQSNPLPICLNPEVVVKLTKS